jgi:hypothetical protein
MERDSIVINNMLITKGAQIYYKPNREWGFDGSGDYYITKIDKPIYGTIGEKIHERDWRIWASDGYCLQESDFKFFLEKGDIEITSPVKKTIYIKDELRKHTI